MTWCKLSVCMAFWLAAILLIAPLSAMADPLAKYVFVISVDGGSPAVLKQSKMPVFFEMIKEGSHTFNARTIFPSITLVSHTSMVTGVGPAKHKITWNDWQPEKGLVQVPTMFSVVSQNRKEVSTALIFGKQKFLHLTLPGSLDTIAMPSYDTKPTAEVAASIIKAVKPNLCFIHFAATDGMGHTYGWGSPEQIKEFGEVDKGLKTIRDAIRKSGIENESVVIITADHGGHDKTHGSDMDADMIIPWVVWGKNVKQDYLIKEHVTTYDTAATVLWLLDVPIPAEWDGKPVKEAFDIN